MTNIEPHLDELEIDALTELVNIGIGRAAASLRKMLERQVLLSVPAVEVVTRRAAAALIGQREHETLVAVEQTFEGTFSGQSLLMFPESNGRTLARTVLGGDTDVGELEEEALAETGNIILNGCLGSMANLLRQSLRMSLPTVRRGSCSSLLANLGQANHETFVLFLYVNFSVSDQNIRGYVAMIMDLPSLEKLRLLIADFVDRIMAD